MAATITPPPESGRPIYSPEGLRARHAGHFFDRDTMRAFGSRLLDAVIPAAGGGRSYFVTSEQSRYGSVWDNRRRYTVRLMSWATGDIGEPEADGFGKYGTAAAAIRAARREAAADVNGAASVPCPDSTHRAYSRPETFRGRDYCGACVDDARRALARRRLASDGPVPTTPAVKLARGDA